MKTYLGLVSCFLLFHCTSGIVRADTSDLFSNFGPGMTFDTTTGWVVAGNGQVVAMQFIPSASAAFADAILPLGLDSPSTVIQATVYLETDTGNKPGTIIEEIPVGPFSTATLVTAKSTLHPLLMGGTPYWLVVASSSSSTLAIWYGDTAGDVPTDNVAFNSAGSPTGPWMIYNSGSRSAFEIDGTVAGTTVVLQSNSGATYSYALSLAPNTTVSFSPNDQIILSGLSGVTGISVGSLGSDGSMTTCGFSVTTACLQVVRSSTVTNTATSPFAFNILAVTSVVLSTGSVNYQLGTSNLGTIGGQVTGPVGPAITALSPNSTTAGGPTLMLMVNGSGFVSGATVQLNGSTLSTTFISDTELTAVVPASLIAVASNSDLIQVGNPGGSYSNLVVFPINSAAGSLTILTLSPMPNGSVGVAYSQGLTATGGLTPYKGWTVASGSTLPPGLSLTQGVLSGTGLLSGTPTSGGTFTFTLQVTDSTSTIASKQFSLTISGGPMTLSNTGIVNAASYTGGRVSPGEIITIFGSFPGPSTLVNLQLDRQGYVSTNLDGEEVLFDGLPAPMIYAVAGQVSAVVPYEVSGESSTQVEVSYQGQVSNSVAVPVAKVVPGVFTVNASGAGQGAVVNQDGTVNSANNPARIGSTVFVYATGEGQTNPAGVDGKPDTAPPPEPIAQPVTATVGGMAAQVEYAGGVSGLVAGVLQVNVQIPQGVSPGNAVAVVLNIAGVTTQENVTIAIR
jgi:uncharacterized protein (TIGR03437 family)